MFQNKKQIFLLFVIIIGLFFSGCFIFKPKKKCDCPTFDGGGHKTYRNKAINPLNNISEEFFPERAFPLFIKMLKPHDVRIRVKRKRSTKYGDFNPSCKTSKTPIITVNNDLNPYFFLITLLHEFAHYLVWKDGHHYAKPHGRTWKIILAD